MDSGFVMRRAEVVSVYDDAGGLRIKARLSGGGDGTKTDEELEYCYPLLPKLLHVNPKPGETVVVLTEKLGASDSQRFFIGPILSQPYNYYRDLHTVTANSLLKDNNNNLKPLPNPNLDSANNGTLPDRDDVAILGRTNADIILKDNEIRIRCGIKGRMSEQAPNNLHFNLVDPAFIQMKYFPSPKNDPSNGREFSSVVNVVGDRINLISPRDGSPAFTSIPDPAYMVSDETLAENLDGGFNVLCDAHPLVYGDELTGFLKQMIEVFRTHTHPYSMLPPTFNQNDTATLNTDLDAMVSKTVRCN